MSLNTAHTDGGVVIHQGEVILLHAPSTVLSFSGSDDLKKYVELIGNSYLTTHRLIFLTKGSKSNLKSFSLPFCVLSEVDVEQPVFGANYLKGKVRAQPNGNWRGESKWKLQFKAGGAIDFAQGMLKAIHIARQTSAQNQYWNEPPPAYAAATFMPAPATYYAPPPSYYGWSYSPNGYSFPAPEAGTVYINEAPPPYPGIGGGFQQPGAFVPTTNVGYGQGPPYQGNGQPQQGYVAPQTYNQPAGYQPFVQTYTNGQPPQAYYYPQHQQYNSATANGQFQQQGYPQQYNPATADGQFQQGYPSQQQQNPATANGHFQQGYAPQQYNPVNANGNSATAPPYTEHYDKKQK